MLSDLEKTAPAPILQVWRRALRDSEIPGERLRVWSLSVECGIKYLASIMVSSLNALNTEAATRVALVALEAESLGGWTETLTECGRVLARERRPAAVTTLLTAFTRKRHDDPEALRTGLEIDLDQPKLWIAWSEIERDRRDYRRSYQLIRQGIDACNSLEGISEIIGHFLALSSENQVKTAAFRGNLDRYPAADAAIRALEAFGDELNGDQLGMLAWLYRLRGKPRDALDTVFTGLRLEPHNPHLLNLESRLREENPDLFGQSTE